MMILHALIEQSQSFHNRVMQPGTAPNVMKSWTIIMEFMERGVRTKFGEPTTAIARSQKKPQWLEKYNTKEMWLAYGVSNLMNYCAPINSYMAESSCLVYQERRTTISRRIATSLWVVPSRQRLKLRMGALSGASHTLVPPSH